MSGLFFILGTVAVVVYSFSISAMWPVLAYFVCIIFFAILLWTLVPLNPVSDEVHVREYRFRRAFWIAIGLFLLGTMMMIWLK